MCALQWSLCTPHWEVRPSLTGWMKLRSPTSSPAKSSWRPDSRLHFFCIKTLKLARFDNWQMSLWNLISPLITVAQTQLFSSLTHISPEPEHWCGGSVCNLSKKRKTWSLSHTCVVCAYVCVCSQGILTEVPRLQHIIVVDNTPTLWPKYQPGVCVHNMAAVQKLGVRSDKGRFVCFSSTVQSKYRVPYSHTSQKNHFIWINFIWKKCFLTIMYF